VEEEKMRSNAAGAIGNLVRNGAGLCKELIRIEIPQALLEMTMHEKLVSPQRIALFSLGTMVMYSQCRAVLVAHKPSLGDLIAQLQQQVSGSPSQPMDDTVYKYLVRLKQKLKMPSISSSGSSGTASGGSSGSASKPQSNKEPSSGSLSARRTSGGSGSSGAVRTTPPSSGAGDASGSGSRRTSSGGRIAGSGGSSSSSGLGRTSSRPASQH
jgi:hypothetical protein